MHIDKIDKYFADRNTKVIYNCLGHTEELVYTYVNNFSKFLQFNKINKSNNFKIDCYNLMYTIESRPKFTGFENFEKIDKKFRRRIRSLITQNQFTPTLVVNHEDINNADNSYKDLLKQTLKTINKPLLYLSGGIDSELVAKAMIDADVKFTPVIFNYVNDLGQTLNLFDYKYAYKFCQKHGLFPVTKSINIEKLWNSKEFELLAIDLGITSPQLVTHAYMIRVMSAEFNDYTHVFGGEVRFETDFIAPDTYKPANLVYLNKTLSSTYGVYIDEDADAGNGYQTTQVSVTLAQGSTSMGATNWYLTFNELHGGGFTNLSWYTVTGTPSPTFYYSITSVSITKTPAADPSLSYFPSSATGYAPVSGGEICSVTNTTNGTSSISGVFGLSIYGSGSSGVVASSTLYIDAYHTL